MRSSARCGELHKRAFFGRRKGHRLKPQQAVLFDTVLPRLALDLNAGAPAITSLFDGAVEDVRLEIGFGGGEHLVAEAQRNSQAGFIGVEPFENGMAKALAAITTRGLANIRLHFGDAIHVLDWLPERSITRLDLIYADPWPKRRHWKRRFVQHASVAAMARVLKPDGLFRFATDSPDYAAWTLRHLMGPGEFEWTAERADDWRQPWPGFTTTRYEAKARRAGRTPCYLTFRRR